MSTVTKWLLAVLVVFNLFLAALMSLLYGYRVSYKQELQQTAQEVDQVRQQKDEKISQLTARISALEEKTSSLSEQLVSKEDEIKELSQDLKDEKNKVSELSGRNTDLNTQVQTLRDENEQHLAKYQEKYGLMGSTKMAPAVEGNVRAVNPEKNIILINLGSSDGVQKGMRFSVVRGEKYVTEVEVVESYETWAAGRSLEKYQKRPPQVGDVVTTISSAPEGNTGVSGETASSRVPADSAGGTTNISTSGSKE